MGSKIMANAWWKTGYDWFEGVSNDNNNDNDGNKNDLGDFNDEYDIGKGNEDKSGFNDEYNDNKSNFYNNVEEAEA